MEINEMSTASLAYLGDAVIEILVRELLVRKGISNSGKLNTEAGKFVRADSQSEAVKRISVLFDEEETGYFRRGRNSVHANIPKSASISQYRDATGMEVVFAYLWLKGDRERINYLFEKAYPAEAENAQV